MTCLRVGARECEERFISTLSVHGSGLEEEINKGAVFAAENLWRCGCRVDHDGGDVERGEKEGGFGTSVDDERDEIILPRLVDAGDVEVESGADDKTEGPLDFFDPLWRGAIDRDEDAIGIGGPLGGPDLDEACAGDRAVARVDVESDGEAENDLRGRLRGQGGHLRFGATGEVVICVFDSPASYDGTAAGSFGELAGDLHGELTSDRRLEYGIDCERLSAIATKASDSLIDVAKGFSVGDELDDIGDVGEHPEVHGSLGLKDEGVGANAVAPEIIGVEGLADAEFRRDFEVGIFESDAVCESLGLFDEYTAPQKLDRW